MKTYRVSRLYRWSWIAAKVVLTIVAAGLYLGAVTHPTPLPLRLALLAGLALFGWLFYVRLPKIPTEITITDDGWVSFKSSRGTTARSGRRHPLDWPQLRQTHTACSALWRASPGAQPFQKAG